MIQNNFQIYSCPSKTLILGGYAIMNPKCSGISIGLEERFYTVIYKNNNNINNNENLKQQDNQQNEITFTFSSPQINSEWIYNFNISKQLLNQINTDKEKSNPFLESTLKVFLSYYKYQETKLENIKIEIYFDSGFYSEKSQIQDKQISKKFKNFDKNNLQKSGLGSSACVIVSVLSALLNFHDIKSNQILEILSQIANIEAQKKVGSGFDIKTSIYGSNIYTMFSKESIMNLNLDQAFKENNLKEILEQQVFQNEDQQKYWGQHQPFDFPQNMKIILIDLNIGSDTRILAGKIKKYLETPKNKEQAENFFNQTNKYSHLINEIFSQKLQIEKQQLQQQQQQNQQQENQQQQNQQQQNQQQQHEKENIAQKNIQTYNKMRQYCQEYRHVLREIGKLTDVEVEPVILTKLLDFLNQQFQNGLYYAICPGAGGYDAFCLLVDKNFSQQELQQQLNQFQKINQEANKFSFQIRETLLSNEGVKNESQNQNLIQEIMQYKL